MEARDERDDATRPGARLDDLWRAVDGLAATFDRARRPATRHPGWITPASLAQELGHDDHGARIRGFLRDPDDGEPPFEHDRLQHWRLSPLDARRVRRRFRAATGRHRLSVREHEAVQLYVAGRSVPEVARALGVGSESVRTYLRRARAKLRALGLCATTREDLRRALAEDTEP